MNISIEIIVASIACGLALAALVGFVASTRRPKLPRLSDGEAIGRPAQDQPFIYSVIGTIARFPVPERITRRLGQQGAVAKLEAAGASPWGEDAKGYISFKVALELATGIIFLLLALTALLPAVGALILFVIFAAALWFLPDWYLRQLHGEHVDKLNRAVPDLVDLLAVSVEGGLSLYNALRQVTERFPAPLGVELQRAMAERDKGKPLAAALRSIYDRTGAEEFRRFVTPFLQAYSEGGKTAENMRTLSEDMRERRKQRAQERGRRAATMVLIPMMFCIFPALLITVVGPALMSFFSSIAGR